MSFIDSKGWGAFDRYPQLWLDLTRSICTDDNRESCLDLSLDRLDQKQMYYESLIKDFEQDSICCSFWSILMIAHSLHSAAYKEQLHCWTVSESLGSEAWIPRIFESLKTKQQDRVLVPLEQWFDKDIRFSSPDFTQKKFSLIKYKFTKGRSYQVGFGRIRPKVGCSSGFSTRICVLRPTFEVGSDFWSRTVGRSWVLNGRPIFVTSFNASDLCCKRPKSGPKIRSDVGSNILRRIRLC